MKTLMRSCLVLISMLMALCAFIAFAENETASMNLTNAISQLNATNVTINTTANMTAEGNLTSPENLTVSGNATASNLTANETALQDETNPFANAKGAKPHTP